MSDSVLSQADSKTIKKVAQMTGRKTVLYFNHARKCWAEIIDDSTSGLKFPLAVSFDVDPTIASEMMTHNVKNRHIEGRRVQRYATSMIEGRWQINNDDICFDVDGNMLNGQHRLKAIIKSGRTIKMSFKFGISPDALITIDEGRSRSNLDVIRITGHEVSRAHLAATNYVLEQTHRRETMPREDVLAFNMRCKEGADFAIKLKSKPFAVAPVHAAIIRAYYHFSDAEDRERLEQFVEVMNTGIYSDVAEDSSAIVLRNRISRAWREMSGRDRLGLSRCTESAINYFIKRQKIDCLKGWDREMFPLPEEKK